jgi:hypothetical protein
MVASVRRRRTPRRSIKVRGSAGRTTEVVREADADKARAGALADPNTAYGARSAVRSVLNFSPSRRTRCGGSGRGGTRKAGDPVLVRLVSRLSAPRRLFARRTRARRGRARSADLKPRYGARSAVRQTTRRGRREIRSCFVSPASPFPPGWKSRCLGGRRRTPAGVLHSLYPRSSGRAGRSGVEDGAIVTPTRVSTSRTATSR